MYGFLLTLCLLSEETASGLEVSKFLDAALHLVPEITSDQVVILQSRDDLKPYLAKRGYSPAIAQETVERVNGLAEFTIDRRFPIFINASSWQIRRLLISWQRSNFCDEAARILASDLFHEYQHAAKGLDEIGALTAHVRLLRKWHNEGRIVVATPYLEAKERELDTLRRTEREPSFESSRSGSVEKKQP